MNNREGGQEEFFDGAFTPKYKKFNHDGHAVKYRRSFLAAAAKQFNFNLNAFEYGSAIAPVS